MAAEIVKQPLAKMIQLVDQVSEAVEEESTLWKHECLDLKPKAEKLAGLLRQVAGENSDLYYESLARRIIGNAEHVVDQALTLVLKCRDNTLRRRVFSIVAVADFHKVSSHLENSIGDVSWLLRASGAEERDGNYLGLPPIVSNNPILAFIWEQVAALHTGSLDDRSDAAESMVSLVRDNDRNGKLIIEEGGIGPLLKLIMEGKKEGQENAVRAIGLLGRGPESVEHMIGAGVCSVFAMILKDGPLNVQAEVAWDISELASKHPECQDHFAQHHVVGLLVNHLAKSIDAVAKFSNQGNETSENSLLQAKGRVLDFEDTEIKAKMKAMAARALWCLAKGNSSICRSIVGSRALRCFAILLEKGAKDVRYNSAMAVKEISAVVEKDEELRRSAAFKPSSNAYKAVVDQVLVVIEKEDREVLIPCIKVIGNFAKTVRGATQKRRVIDLLVRLLDEREADVSREAAISLTKFACTENYLHLDHSNAIISAGGTKHLVHLVYLGEHTVQVPAMFLLSYIVLHVPESEELARAGVLGVLQWASTRPNMTQDQTLKALLQESKTRLELYQSRGSTGFQFPNMASMGRVD